MKEQRQTTYFDDAARTWDEKPSRVKLAGAVAKAIDARIPLDSSMAALEYGCGTGLVSVALAPLLGSITAADSSPEMLKVLKEKIKGMKIENMSAMLLDLTQDYSMQRRFHLIYTSMTLHHIGPVADLIGEFHKLLYPGGWLAIADLDKEKGDFHGDAPGVAHHGFERRALEKILKEKGLTGIQTVTAHEIRKEVRKGKIKTYPVFLMTGRKAGELSM